MKHFLRWVPCLILGVLWLVIIPTQAQETDTFQESLRIGRGAIDNVQWQPNGALILVDTIQGAWLYSLSTQRREFMDVAHIPEARLARFSPDGTQIVGVNAANEITLWDASNFELIATLPGHNTYIRALEWQADGHLLASMDRTGQIFIWDMETYAHTQALFLDSADQILWSPTGTYLAAIDSQSAALKVWDTNGTLLLDNIPDYPRGYKSTLVWRNESQILQRSLSDQSYNSELWNVEHGEKIEDEAVAYSPDGTKMATGTFTRVIVRDSETLKTLYTISSYFPIVVNWSPNGKYLAVGDWSPSFGTRAYVTVVDSETGEIVRKFESKFTIKGIYWRPDGEEFIAVDTANQMYISEWDGRTERMHTHIGNLAVWRSDGEVLAVSSPMGGARLWDTVTGQELIYLSRERPASKIAWQPGGYLLAMTISEWGETANDNVYITDTEDTSSIEPVFTIPHAHYISSIVWSPDGQTLLSSEDRQYIRFWQPQNPDLIRAILSPYPNESIQTNGYMSILSAGWNRDGTIMHVEHRSSGNGGRIALIDVAKEIRLDIDTTSSYGSTWAWTTDNAFIWANWAGYGCGGAPPVRAEILLGGEGVISDPSGTVLLSGLKTQVIEGIFSPDALMLIGFDTENNAVLWDVTTQAVIAQMTDTFDAVWSPDSQLLVIYRTDGSIAILEARSGATVQTLTQHFSESKGDIQAVWSPDSQRLAIVDSGAMFIYDRE